ncbi:IS30 family transposase [Arthrobacter sp. SLBN-112]|uniref:IS30 family transposase n=1 Tax=Arthrobacter sp. SLBN-112 TaxID=2768452 RepID=UPI00114E0699|nr:IS30 family transposase [Arthrobacter sp. SLBN-112]TQJ40481.1 IS30 family transposase [Arthrobacter sp. SLBN-112]
MPAGYVFGDQVRDGFFALLRQGASISEACRVSGLWSSTVLHWIRKMGPVEMSKGNRGGPAGAPFPDGVPGSGRLSLSERAVIMVRLRDGWSYAAIGRELGRDRSVIWREARRNCCDDGIYQSDVAQLKAGQNARRPKEHKLAHKPLARFVESAMDEGWSPQLCSLVLAGAFPDDKRMQISHETIYQAIYVQGRGHVRQDLYRQLSTGRAKRVTDGRGRGRNNSPFKDALKISERPAEAEDRAVPGHWECDLILGSVASNSAIGTCVERSTRYTMLLHLPNGHSADEVAKAMITAFAELPADLRKTLTYDRGVEMARYAQIQIAIDAEIYFSDPHSPWQRGTNENTNRLLRHWFAKSTDLSVHTAQDIKRAQDSLNNRPRPTLGLATPKQKFNELLLAAAA